VFELTTLVVIGTDCTGSCKSNYDMTTTAPQPNERGQYLIEIEIEEHNITTQLKALSNNILSLFSR